MQAIEIIHYYLCYLDTPHLDLEDRDLLRRQSNVLYHSSRIAHRLLAKRKYLVTLAKRYQICFTAYVLCLKWLTDATLCNCSHLSKMFGVDFTPKTLNSCEVSSLRSLNYSFEFLNERPAAWDVKNCLNRFVPRKR